MKARGERRRPSQRYRYPPPFTTADGISHRPRFPAAHQPPQRQTAHRHSANSFLAPGDHRCSVAVRKPGQAQPRPELPVPFRSDDRLLEMEKPLTTNAPRLGHRRPGGARPGGHWAHRHRKSAVPDPGSRTRAQRPQLPGSARNERPWRPAVVRSGLTRSRQGTYGCAARVKARRCCCWQCSAARSADAVLR